MLGECLPAAVFWMLACYAVLQSEREWVLNNLCQAFSKSLTVSAIDPSVSITTSAAATFTNLWWLGSDPGHGCLAVHASVGHEAANLYLHRTACNPYLIALP